MAAMGVVYINYYAINGRSGEAWLCCFSIIFRGFDLHIIKRISYQKAHGFKLYIPFAK